MYKRQPDDPAPSHSDSESTISERHSDISQHGPANKHTDTWKENELRSLHELVLREVSRPESLKSPWGTEAESEWQNVASLLSDYNQRPRSPAECHAKWLAVMTQGVEFEIDRSGARSERAYHECYQILEELITASRCSKRPAFGELIAAIRRCVSPESLRIRLIQGCEYAKRGLFETLLSRCQELAPGQASSLAAELQQLHRAIPSTRTHDRATSHPVDLDIGHAEAQYVSAHRVCFQQLQKLLAAGRRSGSPTFGALTSAVRRCVSPEALRISIIQGCAYARRGQWGTLLSSCQDLTPDQASSLAAGLRLLLHPLPGPDAATVGEDRNVKHLAQTVSSEQTDTPEHSTAPHHGTMARQGAVDRTLTQFFGP